MREYLFIARVIGGAIALIGIVNSGEGGDFAQAARQPHDRQTTLNMVEQSVIYRFFELKHNRRFEIKNNSIFANRDLENNSSIDESELRSLPYLNEEDRAIALTLTDVVILAVQNNRDIKNAYLQRIADRENLAVELDKFSPNIIPEVSLSVGSNDLGSLTTNSAQLGFGAIVSVALPTGAEISAEWETSSIAQNNSEAAIDDETRLQQNIELRFSQPLLRGFGREVNLASIEVAKLSEQVNILNLKSTLIETISNAIVAYRDLVRAQEQVEIERLSLQRAKELLEINRVLIEAGRRAPIEIVQSQTNVANQEVRVLEAENDLESRQLALIEILDIDQQTKITAIEQLEIEEAELPQEQELIDLAYQNRPDFLQALLDLEIAEFDVLLAEDNQRWDLDLEASYISGLRTDTDDTNDLRAGLNLSREFGDRTLQRDLETSRVNILQEQNRLEDLRETIKIEVRDRIRDVNLLRRQVELARTAKELSAQKLANERELLKLGRSSIAEIVRFQEDLVEATNAELNAKINYLNALTQLDRTVGITLDTWEITVHAFPKLD
nr:TolC family protein [Oxynema sp. CENA135]